MAKNKGRNAVYNYGICTNTTGKEDGTPCSKCQNKEIQAIRSTKEFVCEECGEPLMKTKGPKPGPDPKWWIIIALIVGLVTGGYFLFRSCSNSKVRITVVSSDETMGTVKGSGKYEFNKLITIEANANEGYRFVSWDDNNTKNPREILAKEDGTYTAIFEPAPAPPASVTIKVVSSDESMGVVRGGGTYGSGDTIKIEAEAKDGYRFMSWNDGNRERTREIVATNDITYTAQFSPEPPQTAPVVTITVESSDETMGTVRGGGTYDSMITISIEAIANKGYEFDSWNDGNIENPRKVITGRDETYVAKFKKLSYNENNQGTYELEWGTYEGPMHGGKPHGKLGKVTVTRVHNIEIGGEDNLTITVYPGETITTKFENGRLRSGEIHHKDGSNDLFTIF